MTGHITRIDINHDAISELLTGSAIQAELRRHAEQVAARAGPGMEIEEMVGRTRARVSIVTATDEARRAEATGRRLSMAVRGG